MLPGLEFDRKLISRYDKSGPRYTSYPTANQFHEQFSSLNYEENAVQTNEDLIPRPLSLYFHLPFCSTVCYYCACNKIITANRKHAEPYLELLHREIKMQAHLFDDDRKVEQLHWGGGTPTFISHGQMSGLMDAVRSAFSLVDDDSGEYSVELDPRECREGTLALLRSLGFNRISLGVQDFNPDVQKAVNRLQGEDETLEVINEARALGFRSISLDLIYGLPRQTLESFSKTLEKVIAMQPDRLSIFNYAHMPDRFKVQKQIREDELPDATEKLKIYENNIRMLSDAGYVYIGMDHYARPDDELAIAQQENKLTRNFQGYSTRGYCDVVGMGISAISKIGNCYAQNHHGIPEYEFALASSNIPVCRGFKLDTDDVLRRFIIEQLICHFSVSFIDVEDRYGIEFQDYFYNELQTLKDMQEDGLLTIDRNGIQISPTGRLLIRNICMNFDKYLRQTTVERIFSRLI